MPLTDALLATAHDLLAGLGIAAVAAGFVYLVLRSNEGLRSREDARRKLFEPAGSNDLRRALRYRGIAPELLGQENVALYSGSTRDRRRG
jgi:hypothetical protein